MPLLFYVDNNRTVNRMFFCYSISKVLMEVVYVI